MDFFSDSEAWHFPTYQYPTWDDCMRFYISRTKNKVPQKSAIYQLSEAVVKIWKSGDGCPKSWNIIMLQFENTVLPQYQKYRKGDTVTGKKKKKISVKPTPSPITIRKISRTQTSQTDTPDLLQWCDKSGYPLSVMSSCLSWERDIGATDSAAFQ